MHLQCALGGKKAIITDKEVRKQKVGIDIGKTVNYTK